MRFIINKLADIRTLRNMEEAVSAIGDYGVRPQEIKTTVFTDEPLETRRRLEVTLRAYATPDGLTVDMVLPIEANTAYLYTRWRSRVPFYELVVLDPVTEELGTVVPDTDADDIEELPDVAEDTRSTYEHLLEWAEPVIVGRRSVAVA